jgi:hypothetical protein
VLTDDHQQLANGITGAELRLNIQLGFLNPGLDTKWQDFFDLLRLVLPSVKQENQDNMTRS